MYELSAEPLERQASLKDQALALVRQAIVSGDLEPGAMYSAAALAKQLGISLSPAREAMLSLVHDGILETVKNRGYRVVELDDAELSKIVELRSLLEIPTVVSLCPLDLGDRLGPLRSLAEQIEAAARAGDVSLFLQHDRDFHLGLLALAGNDRLVDLVARLRDQTRLYGLHALAQNRALEHSAREHTELLDAIAARDEDRTRELMSAHLRHIERDWKTGQPVNGTT